MITLSRHLDNVGTATAIVDISYMSGGRFVGKIGHVFGEAEIMAWHVGPSLGADAQRGCYDHWIVTDGDGKMIGELRDDANGYTFHDAWGDPDRMIEAVSYGNMEAGTAFCFRLYEDGLYRIELWDDGTIAAAEYFKTLVECRAWASRLLTPYDYESDIPQIVGIAPQWDGEMKCTKWVLIDENHAGPEFERIWFAECDHLPDLPRRFIYLADMCVGVFPQQ